MSRISPLVRWLIPASLLLLGTLSYGQESVPTPLADLAPEQIPPAEFCPPEIGDYGFGPNGGYGSGPGGYAYVLPCRELDNNQPDLFYNFYVPNQCGSLPAAMYLCPRPVPPLVGHTYYTYQPFLPHEFLYEHKRTYYRYYNDGRGLNRTKIKWEVAPTTHVHNIWHWMRIPR